MDDHDQAALAAPERLNYFTGRLLTADDFELEQRYGMSRHRLVNRLVHGHGVVSGLGVEVADGGESLRVLPGLAIDALGREIVVPAPSAWLAVQPGLGAHALVAIAYAEAPGDSAPTVVDDSEPGVPGTISEGYRIALSAAGRPRHPKGRRAGFVSDGGIDAAALARWVSDRPATSRLPDDPSVPLANVRLTGTAAAPLFDPAGVDIAVRPVVLSNAVLLEVIRDLIARRR
jgi:hypothetical protein